jgi:hypothetical protein
VLRQSTWDAQYNNGSRLWLDSITFTSSNPHPIPPGDVNGDQSVDLQDAILSAQVLTGIPPAQSIYPGSDVNGNGSLGLEECIFILQSVSGIK